MVPPKDPYIKVRVLDDMGEGILLSDKTANLARHSMHFLKRTDAEQYIARVGCHGDLVSWNCLLTFCSWPTWISLFSLFDQQGLMEELTGWHCCRSFPDNFNDDGVSNVNVDLLFKLPQLNAPLRHLLTLWENYSSGLWWFHSFVEIFSNFRMFICGYSFSLNIIIFNATLSEHDHSRSWLCCGLLRWRFRVPTFYYAWRVDSVYQHCFSQSKFW